MLHAFQAAAFFAAAFFAGAFGARGWNRIGQPTMRNLDITDTRQKLGICIRTGLLGAASDSSILLPTGSDAPLAD